MFYFKSLVISTLETFSIVAGSDPHLKEALLKLSELLIDEDWKVKNGDEEIAGIEHPGLHMMLKKLAQNDAVALKSAKSTFAGCLCSTIDDETVRAFYRPMNFSV